MMWNPDVQLPASKENRYAWINQALEEIIHSEGEGQLDEIALMATLSSLLKVCLPHIFWVGFYRLVAKDRLIIGPYQGTPGCLYIPVPQGVCGKCARERKPIIVPDVQAFPGHIVCDPRSRSELVLPVINNQEHLIGVLDLDSHEKDAFDEVDVRGCEKLLSWFKR